MQPSREIAGIATGSGKESEEFAEDRACRRRDDDFTFLSCAANSANSSSKSPDFNCARYPSEAVSIDAVLSVFDCIVSAAISPGGSNTADSSCGGFLAAAYPSSIIRAAFKIWYFSIRALANKNQDDSFFLEFQLFRRISLLISNHAQHYLKHPWFDPCQE